MIKKFTGKFRFEILFSIIFVLLSGNIPLASLLFMVNKSIIFLLFAFILFFNVLLSHKKIKSAEYYYFLFIIIAQVTLTFLQVIKGSKVSGNVITQFVLFTMAFLLWINSGTKLFHYIPKIVVALIKFSLIFYIPAVILYLLGINILDLIPDFMKFPNSMDINEAKTHVVFHNYRAFAIGDTEKFYRNAGCFWEPGAFGGIIVFAFLLFIAGMKSLTIEKRRHILYWLVFGILTTQSTAALILLPLLIMLYETERREEIRQLKKFFYIGIPFIIIVFYFMFTNIPVLQEKLVGQFEMVQTEESFWERTRIGTMVILSVVIKNNPLFGVGFGETDFANAIYRYLGLEIEGLGNGMFIYIAKAGIPFFLLIAFLLFQRLRKIYTKNMSGILAIIILMGALQGEAWMEHPFIYIFLFVGPFAISGINNETDQIQKRNPNQIS